MNISDQLQEAIVQEGNVTKKFVGSNARLQWNNEGWKIEELPQKGKSKLRVAEMQNPFGRLSYQQKTGSGAFIPANVLRRASLSQVDNYDNIKNKISKSMNQGFDEFVKYGDADYAKKHKDTLTGFRWIETQVYFLKVAPENTEPLVVRGKDFTIKSEWTTFGTYAPSSNFHQADPHYTRYSQKSAAGARKLYLILQSNPKVLSNIVWDKFGNWLNKNKIPYKTIFSQY